MVKEKFQEIDHHDDVSIFEEAWVAYMLMTRVKRGQALNVVSPVGSTDQRYSS